MDAVASTPAEQRCVLGRVQQRVRVMAACSALILVGSSALAQSQPLPGSPSLEDLRAALFPSNKPRNPEGAPRSLSVRLTPSTDGLCADPSAEERPGAPKAPMAASSATTLSGPLKRNLLPVPYVGGTTPHVELSINFAERSDAPNKESLKLIDTLAALLKESGREEAHFAIAGHTNSSGEEAVNLRLSCARALAVQRALVLAGVAPERLSAYGFGSRKPLNAADTTAPENRRVEIRRAN